MGKTYKAHSKSSAKRVQLMKQSSAKRSAAKKGK